MAKKITKYQADDGTEFNTEAEADLHDNRCRVLAYFQQEFDKIPKQSGWDFTVAFTSGDTDTLVISVNDLPGFLVCNAEHIIKGYGIANLIPQQKLNVATTVVQGGRGPRHNRQR